MVVHDVSAHENKPGPPPLLLVARLHVDLCRLGVAGCRRRAAARP
jgi:hypothetical protein